MHRTCGCSCHERRPLPPPPMLPPRIADEPLRMSESSWWMFSVLMTGGWIVFWLLMLVQWCLR